MCAGLYLSLWFHLCPKWALVRRIVPNVCKWAPPTRAAVNLCEWKCNNHPNVLLLLPVSCAQYGWIGSNNFCMCVLRMCIEGRQFSLSIVIHCQPQYFHRAPQFSAAFGSFLPLLMPLFLLPPSNFSHTLWWDGKSQLEDTTMLFICAKIQHHFLFTRLSRAPLSG